MPSYPAYKQLLGSRDEPTQPTQTFIAGDGGARVYVPVKKLKFQLRHLLTSAELATLIAFYETNKTAAVDLTWKKDATVYSVYFTERPQGDVNTSNPRLRDVTVNLAQV